MERDPEFVKRDREYQRRYYLERREAKLAYAKRHRAEHRDEINARRRKPVEERTYKVRGITSLDGHAEYNRRYHTEVKAEDFLRERIRVLQKVSGLLRPQCITCDETDVLVLQLNHTGGGGRREVRGRPRFFYGAILDGSRPIEGLTVACANCNVRHEYVRGYRHLPRDWEAIIAEMTTDDGSLRR